MFMILISHMLTNDYSPIPRVRDKQMPPLLFDCHAVSEVELDLIPLVGGDLLNSVLLLIIYLTTQISIYKI